MVVMVKMSGNVLRSSTRYSCYSDWVRNKELAVSLWFGKMVKKIENGGLCLERLVVVEEGAVRVDADCRRRRRRRCGLAAD